MNCCESLQGELDLLHTKTKYKSQGFLHSGVFSASEVQCFRPPDIHSLSLSDNMMRYQQLIENYSGRGLTFEEDSLHAFAGIAKHLARSKVLLLHVLGIPFPLPSLLESPSEDCQYLSLSLLWVHTGSYDSELKPLTRRPAFPSWSWAGRRSRVIFLPMDDVYFNRACRESISSLSQIFCWNKSIYSVIRDWMSLNCAILEVCISAPGLRPQNCSHLSMEVFLFGNLTGEQQRSTYLKAQMIRRVFWKCSISQSGR